MQGCSFDVWSGSNQTTSDSDVNTHNQHSYHRWGVRVDLLIWSAATRPHPFYSQVPLQLIAAAWGSSPPLICSSINISPPPSCLLLVSILQNTQKEMQLLCNQRTFRKLWANTLGCFSWMIGASLENVPSVDNRKIRHVISLGVGFFWSLCGSSLYTGTGSCKHAITVSSQHSLSALRWRADLSSVWRGRWPRRGG